MYKDLGMYFKNLFLDEANLRRHGHQNAHPQYSKPIKYKIKSFGRLSCTGLVFRFDIHTRTVTHGGSSTIDYSLCTPTLYESAENVFVLPRNELSDHLKIITFFKKYIEISGISPDTYLWTTVKPKFKWDNSK